MRRQLNSPDTAGTGSLPGVVSKNTINIAPIIHSLADTMYPFYLAESKHMSDHIVKLLYSVSKSSALVWELLFQSKNSLDLSIFTKVRGMDNTK